MTTRLPYSTEQSGFPCRFPTCQIVFHPDYSAVPGDINFLTGLRVPKSEREAASVAALQAAAREREFHEEAEHGNA